MGETTLKRNSMGVTSSSNCILKSYNLKELSHEQLSDSIYCTLAQMSSSEVMTPEEEVEAFKRLEAAKTEEERLEIRNDIAEANMKLVAMVAKKFPSTACGLDDCIQEGYLGLLTAIDKFEYQRGFKFSTYATWWIKQAITRAKVDKYTAIRLPIHMVEEMNKVRKFRDEYISEHNGVEPDLEVIMEKFELSKESINYINFYINYNSKFVSINQQISPGDEDKSYEYGELLRDNRVSVEEDSCNSFMSEYIQDLLKSCLSDKEYYVIVERYGLNDGTPKTLQIIGAEMGVTRERVRQIECNAMRKLKRRKRYLSDETLLERRACI